jgi:hypothetical protein
MSALAGPLAAMAALLAVGGALKVRQPANTVNALKAAGLPATPTGVRIAAAAELIIGVGTLVAEGPAFPALLALSYAAFTGFVAFALSKHTPLDTCGCFGTPDTPPTVLHVLVTAGAAGVGAAAAVTDTSVADVVADQPWAGIPFAAISLLIAYLAYLVMAVLPKAKANTT